MHSTRAPIRLLVACIVLAAAHLGSAASASAGTCGVLPFTHGADVTEGAATNITSLVSTELDFRGGWTIVVTASKQEITDGCGGDQSCLMAFGKGESHDGVVTGTIATEGDDKYRITTRWYEVGTGRMKREVSQAINRSADLLIEEVPGLVTELLTGKKPASPEEAEEESAESFASLDEIDFDDLDEEEEEEERPRVRQRAKPKRDNRGRLREPVEEADDPFGLDVDDLDDLDEIEEKNDRERAAALERAHREEEERRAREEERRRAERIAEERRAEEEAEERAREERRERESRARERAEREREEDERRARAEQRRREREEEERREREAREREEERERARAARERREREEAEERERRVREREEREREARVAAAEREREEAEERDRRDREEREARREAEEREDRERRERLAEERRRDRERERERDREPEPEDDGVDYAAVELGSALAAGAISFASDEDEEEGYVGFVMEDADEDEDDDESYISMEDADEDEDDEPQVGDIVTGGGYDDPGARRRANAADRRSDREDRYSRARSFGSSSSDDDDDDDDDGYRSEEADDAVDLDDDDDDDRLASRDDSVVDDRRGRSRRSESRDRDARDDGTYRYRPRDRDDDYDDDYDDDSYSSRRSTGRSSGRASATKTTSDPSGRRHVSIRGSGGVSNYYLWFGQYGLDLGIFPVDALSIDVGVEGWSLSLTEQAEDEAGEPLWDENGEAITTTELRTLPHLSIGASWRGNFHRVIKPYAGGDLGTIMYATEKHSDGSTTPRFGVTGMAKGGADFMINKVIGAHVGVRVGVAYSPLVEELVYFEWNPVTFVFNLKAGLTLTF